MILSAIAAKLKQRAKGDFKGRHYEAALIVQAVSWYLRYPLSYRDAASEDASIATVTGRIASGNTMHADCPPSALLRQIEGLHERRMAGSS